MSSWKTIWNILIEQFRYDCVCVCVLEREEYFPTQFSYATQKKFDFRSILRTLYVPYNFVTYTNKNIVW